MLCKVAWADGVVDEAERGYVHGMIERLGGEALAPGELDKWLEEGVPADQLGVLPDNLQQFFFYEALKLAEVDGDLAEKEQEVLEKIMQRVFEPHEENATLGQIARIRLVRKRVES